MKKHLITLFAFLTIQLSLQAFPATQFLQVSYCDDSRFDQELPKIPNFMSSSDDQALERGYMALYQHVIFDALGAFTVYGGGNVGRWEGFGDQITTGSAFVSARLWVLHVLFMHPYIEYSMFGPTLASKNSFGDLSFRSNFLFQSFFGTGVEFGQDRGFSLDLKLVRYYESYDFTPNDGFKTPIIASFGVCF